MKTLTNDEITQLLNWYNVFSYDKFELIDSSHGEEDIRHNYVIDNKYVLRFNSAKVMSNERIKELNVLIKRYHEFGLKAPYFICNADGDYVLEYEDGYCYLSEYLDYELADNIKDSCRKELIEERVIFVSKFAEKYKNVDLIDTMSMYSLFELSPYDKEIGIDEKQDNFNNLINDLKNIGEMNLSDELTTQYNAIRKELLSFYKELPRCVFQGDENFSNLCVDNDNHIIGLFDFNMSGTEVVANYLANIAFQGNFFYTDEILDDHDAKEVFDMVVASYKESTDIIRKYYNFTTAEFKAYKLYSQIVMISGYVNQAAFAIFLNNKKTRDKAVELIRLISKFEFLEDKT